jgi:hypothetical protein
VTRADIKSADERALIRQLRARKTTFKKNRLQLMLGATAIAFGAASKYIHAAAFQFCFFFESKRSDDSCSLNAAGYETARLLDFPVKFPVSREFVR